jgi:tetratricopeptide (TPR) repeat protein
MSMATSKRTIGLALLLALRVHSAFAHGDAVCSPELKKDEIAVVRASVDRAPESLAPRLALADLLVQEGCYDEALHALEAAQERHSRDAELLNKMKLVRSFVSERQFFDGLDTAQAEARLSRNLLRCTRLDDVAACDEAARMKPDNGEIIAAKGAALAKSGRLAEALTVYRRAIALNPANTQIDARLRDVQSQRQRLAAQCTTGEGDAALQACDAALLTGEADEFDMRRRIAVLHQASNRIPEALNAYIAARTLRPGDAAIARAIVALVDSTGRKDATALAVKGASLLALGRAREALPPLEQARALAPDLPDLAAAISAAEQQLRLEQRVASTKPALQPVIVPAVAAQAVQPEPPRLYSNAGMSARSH